MRKVLVALAVVAIAALAAAGAAPVAGAPTRLISSAGVTLRIPADWYASTAPTSGCDPQRLLVASSAPLHLTAGALAVPEPHQVDVVVLEDHQRQDRPLGNLRRPSRFSIDWRRRTRVQGCPDRLPTAAYTRWFKAQRRYLGFTVYAGTAVTEGTRTDTVAALNSIVVNGRPTEAASGSEIGKVQTATLSLRQGHSVVSFRIRASAAHPYDVTVSAPSSADVGISMQSPWGPRSVADAIHELGPSCAARAGHLHCVLHFAEGGTPGGTWTVFVTKKSAPAAVVRVGVEFLRS